MFVLFALVCGEGVHGADGAALFAERCAACHGLDGKARTPAGKKFGARDLTDSKFTDAAIRDQILEGVKDKNGRYRMPAFKDQIAADDIAALVAFVKTFRR